MPWPWPASVRCQHSDNYRQRKMLSRKPRYMVVRETPSITATSLTLWSPYGLGHVPLPPDPWQVFSDGHVCARGRAVRPACVNSRMSSRSNSASTPQMWNTRRPSGVVVSILSVKLLKPTPHASSSFTASIRRLRLRPRPSRRHTTRVLPSRSAA